MWQKLKLSSLGGLFGLVPFWAQVLAIGLIATSLFLAGAKLNGKRWAAKVAADDRARQTQVIRAQSDAAVKTTENATATAQLDKTYYEEYQNAQKTADYWRNRVRTERVPVCAKTANNPETRATGSMGNDPATDASADRSVDLPSAAIIQLSESAGKMRAQVEYFQSKLPVDHATINGDQK